MSTFLIKSATSQSSSYPIVLTRLGGPRSRPNPNLKFVEVPGIEPATSWSDMLTTRPTRRSTSWNMLANYRIRFVTQYITYLNICLLHYQPMTDCCRFEILVAWGSSNKSRIDSLIGMCLLAGPDLWRIMLLKITMVFTWPLLSLCKISSPFRENNNMVISFPHLHAVGRNAVNFVP